MQSLTGVTAAALLQMLKPNYAWATQVPPDDKRIRAETQTVPSPQGNGSIRGYLVRPADETKLPAVLVIHENRGLNPYIEDVARRLAVADFIAFAPDALTSLGGYPGDDEKGLALFQQLDRGKMTEDFLAAARWLKSRPDTTGKLGAVGFCCLGGGVVNQLAVLMGPDLAAGVPFYGAQPSAADAAKIKAPINAQYGEQDTRITDGWPAFDVALTEAKVLHWCRRSADVFRRSACRARLVERARPRSRHRQRGRPRSLHLPPLCRTRLGAVIEGGARRLRHH
jgi:carboxymethylenebutenolidase